MHLVVLHELVVEHRVGVVAGRIQKLLEPFPGPVVDCREKEDATPLAGYLDELSIYGRGRIRLTGDQKQEVACHETRIAFLM
jgi:hypothetical protein